MYVVVFVVVCFVDKKEKELSSKKESKAKNKKIVELHNLKNN